MTATLQHLNMSELLHHDEDAVDPYGPNDIDVSRIITGGCQNNDFTFGGSPAYNYAYEFNNIFSHNIKEKPWQYPQ